jgi:hypothetical protein
MLVAQVPQQYVDEIDCSDIHPFQTLKEASLYQKLKGKDFMVIKNQDENTWYVMPNYNGVLVGSCFSE